MSRPRPGILFAIVAAAWLTLALTSNASAEGRDSVPGALTAQPNASASPEARKKSHRMVARIWHGRTLTTKADEYEKYLENSGVKKILSTDGNHGVEVLRRTNGDQTDFVVISYWESIEAVKRFAGADYQKAVILPRDAEFLIDVEPEVVHYEVVRAGGK